MMRQQALDAMNPATLSTIKIRYIQQYAHTEAAEAIPATSLSPLCNTIDAVLYGPQQKQASYLQRSAICTESCNPCCGRLLK